MERVLTMNETACTIAILKLHRIMARNRMEEAYREIARYSRNSSNPFADYDRAACSAFSLSAEITSMERSR